MALQKNTLELTINGEKLQFSLSPDEVPVYVKAEAMINKRIADFNKRFEGKNATNTQFLKAVMVKLAVDLLKIEDQKANTERKIKEIYSHIEDLNTQIDNYLDDENNKVV